MASILYKWLIAFALSSGGAIQHPFYVSVTEIKHNAAGKTLEVGCKIFTNDFESALRKIYKIKVDLLDEQFKPPMNTIVSDYIQKRLSIVLDGKAVTLQFLGFEQDEEGIVSYFEVKEVSGLHKLEVVNKILYEFAEQQMGIIHVTVNGERKSSRLNNPDSTAAFLF